MSSIDCPDWEYADHPNRLPELRRKTSELMLALRRGALTVDQQGKDTRSVHAHLFSSLTPLNFEHYAGHYRGEALLCLEDYAVTADGDPNVGEAPASVARSMWLFGEILLSNLRELDERAANVRQPAGERIKVAAIFACEAFVEFLRIHPYANGNGHTARFLVWLILGRYGLWPQNFPIEPRPREPQYVSYIRMWRAGNKGPLINYFIRCLVP